MKMVVNVTLIIATISLIIGIITRVTMKAVGPMGLEAPAYHNFTNTCLLVAITFILLQLLGKR